MYFNDFNFNLTHFIAWLFLICLAISYIMARFVNNGEFKIKDHDTVKYLLTVFAIFLVAVIMTAAVLLYFGFLGG